ncbi:MAG: hypothetical protein FJX56_06825 [Alphaproteobacteria bacterium]|nr:hypothetical protein [Alphaproteobacteria bacterium]
MSRLDSFIRRISAQRDCLNLAARLLAGLPGPVLELGLGNGRTFDHLRQLLPDREIFVFDRQVAAHPDCIPDTRHLILGDIRETLPRAGERIHRPAALAHCDMGTGDRDAAHELARFLATHLEPLLADGAIIISDQPMSAPTWVALPLPAKVKPGRYFMAQVRRTG